MTDAIKLAIDALEAACGNRCNAEYNPCQAREAIAALRAQPATTPREASDFQKWSVLAYRALDDAGRVLMTVEPECSTESDNLSVLTETIRELMYQALTLNGVLSRRDMDRKFRFGKLDSDALLRAQPAGWIDASKQMPPPQVRVLGFEPKYNIVDVDMWFGPDFQWGYSYWMPLPPPPAIGEAME